jgi:CRISPR type III-A-associated RAMP protein Csm4
MKIVLLACPPSARFRFGKASLDVNTSLAETDTVLHADTLFGAILSIAASIFTEEQVEDLIHAFESGQAAISSTSYCFQKNGGSTIYFLPKPICYNLLAVGGNADEERDRRKMINKIKFISKAVFEAGTLPTNWKTWKGESTDELLDEYAYIISRTFILTKAELDGLYSESERQSSSKQQIFSDQVRPRIADQVRKPENNFYFQSELRLNPHDRFATHLYFLLEAEGEQLEQLTTIIALLADTGVGGRVSSGCGRLLNTSIQEEPFELQIDQVDSDYKLNVGLLSPTKEEINRLKHYQLLTRGGRRVAGGEENPEAEQIEVAGEQTSNILKRVKMLKEGAIVGHEVIGAIPDISPNQDRSFLRYGRAFLLPISTHLLQVDTHATTN